jgi:insertion element IS1 protein InsB
LNPYLPDIVESKQLSKLDVEIIYSAETDEMWSYVQNKGNQRWLWYAIEKKTGVIIAWHCGRRTDEELAVLLSLMSHLTIDKYYTDDWGGYTRLLPDAQHVIGKSNTQTIERKNLNFRTHIKRLTRKTICFSKSEQIHDNVIGLYIQTYYFKCGLYSQSVNQRI